LLRRSETLRNILLPDTMHAHQAMKIVCEIRIAGRHQRLASRVFAHVLG
jgi:hypothetical protein